MCYFKDYFFLCNLQHYFFFHRSDQNFYGQFPSIRPQGFDCGSYGYYDCSTSGRGFIPVAGDIAFPSISDKVDIINNNNGKRRGDHSQDKHYKRNRHECFSLQQQIDDGFV